MGRETGEEIISLRHEKMAERKRRGCKIISCVRPGGGGRTGGGSFQMYAAIRGLPHIQFDVMQVSAGEVVLRC